MPTSEALKDYIDDDNPLGPIQADVVEDVEIMKLLFAEDNGIYKELERSPIRFEHIQRGGNSHSIRLP